MLQQLLHRLYCHLHSMKWCRHIPALCCLFAFFFLLFYASICFWPLNCLCLYWCFDASIWYHSGVCGRVLHLLYFIIQIVFDFIEICGYFIGWFMDNFEEFSLEPLASWSDNLLKFFNHFLYVIENELQINSNLS